MAVKEQLDRLAAFEPAPYPVVSLYLNTQPGQTGRDQFKSFVRKEFAARSRTYEAGSPERESLDKDLERIARFLDNELDPAANGVAIFRVLRRRALRGDSDDRTDRATTGSRSATSRISIRWRASSRCTRGMPRSSPTPTPRASWCLRPARSWPQREIRASRRSGTRRADGRRRATSATSRTSTSSTSKDVIDALEKIVQRENITEIIVAGDEVVMPLLREQMPKHLAEGRRARPHEPHTPVEQLIDSALDALKRVHTEDRAREGRDGRRRVPLRRARRGRTGGHARSADQGTGRRAADLGAASRLQPVGALRAVDRLRQPRSRPARAGARDRRRRRACRGAMPRWFASPTSSITKAAQTCARITFVQDPELLADYGGVAAILRFKI